MRQTKATKRPNCKGQESAKLPRDATENVAATSPSETKYGKLKENCLHWEPRISFSVIELACKALTKIASSRVGFDALESFHQPKVFVKSNANWTFMLYIYSRPTAAAGPVRNIVALVLAPCMHVHADLPTLQCSGQRQGFIFWGTLTVVLKKLLTSSTTQAGKQVISPPRANEKVVSHSDQKGHFSTFLFFFKHIQIT